MSCGNKNKEMQPIPFAWYELFKMHIEHSLDQSIKKVYIASRFTSFCLEYKAFKELFINNYHGQVIFTKLNTTLLDFIVLIRTVTHSQIHILGTCHRGGGGGGGGRRSRPTPKIGKNMIFWRKIVIFHTKYPNNFRASLRSAQFYLSAPPPPNLKS